MQPSSLQLHPPALPQASVTLQGLALRYGNQTVLDGLDWQLLPGQVVGLLGRNGAGKTTLLESLLGLRDVQGRIELFGEPVATLGDAARARLGYVPQHSDLFKWMTADEMLAYFRSFYPRWNGDKVDALLQRWAIARDKPIGRLSGGEQQRLAIVRALAHEPDLLVLDEPVASLDPAGRRDFLQELVTQVLARGTTVVFSTHILSDLERVAFNVAFMARGRIALQAPLDELLESTRHISGPAALLDGWARGRDVLHRAPLPDGRLRLLVRRSLQELAACPSAACPSAACPPDACPPGACPPGADVRNVTLDDLFMDLT